LIRYFGNKAASDLYHNGSCKGLPRAFWRRGIHLLEVMDAVDNLDDLVVKGFPPSIRLHQLKGVRRNEWAIDIHKTSGWRITFQVEGGEFVGVKIENYH
jgi:plasmid maintenance system killer protein